jgi:hypothetical protein
MKQATMHAVFQLFFQNSGGRRFTVAFFGCFLTVFHFVFRLFFLQKIFELAVKTDTKQTEKQPKNVTVSIPIESLQAMH